jgi:rod shape-determining protein MreD
LQQQSRRIEERIVREIGLLLLLLGAALVQVALLPAPFGTPPALLLVLVVCRTLAAGATEGVRWAFYGGLALDVCASAPLGSHALALLAAVLLVHLLSRRLRGEHWLIPIVATFVGALTYEALLALIFTLRVAPLDWRVYAVVALLPAALLAMVPALPIYMLLRQIERRRRDAALEL